MALIISKYTLKVKLKQNIDNVYVMSKSYAIILNNYEKSIKNKERGITMEQLENKDSNKTFEDIKHIDKYGNEYWYARELQKVLEYKEWRNFDKVLKKAIVSAENSVSQSEDWVVEVNKPIISGKGKKENIKDFKLTSYICYLIVQNADPIKKIVALGQTYFAIQTRKQEITELEYDSLSDDEKRFYQRKLTKQGNNTLQKVAVSAVFKIWLNFIMLDIKDYIMEKQLMIFLRGNAFGIEKIF